MVDTAKCGWDDRSERLRMNASMGEVWLEDCYGDNRVRCYDVRSDGMMLGKYLQDGVSEGAHGGWGDAEAPQGILKKCNAARAIFTEDVKRIFYICPKCGNYFRVHAYRGLSFFWMMGVLRNGIRDDGRNHWFPGYEKGEALQEEQDLRRLL